MTIQQVVNKILSYHPKFMQYMGCDEFKCGDPSRECTGIITAMSPTIHVVQKAIELGANLIVVHEPTNYTSKDRPGWQEDFGNAVFAEKMRLCEEHGIAIWRDHDHLHAHRPDGIFTGVLKYMGWEEYAKVDTSLGTFAHFVVELPEATTLGTLLNNLCSVIGTNGARYIGGPDMPVKKIAIVGHLYPMPGREKNAAGLPREYSVEIIRYFEEQHVDVILPGETIDWTVLAYVRDAVQLGQDKAVISLGHFNWEELGMRYASEWVSRLLEGELSVTYVPSEDMFNYYTV